MDYDEPGFLDPSLPPGGDGCGVCRTFSSALWCSIVLYGLEYFSYFTGATPFSIRAFSDVTTYKVRCPSEVAQACDLMQRPIGLPKLFPHSHCPHMSSLETYAPNPDETAS